MILLALLRKESATLLGHWLVVATLAGLTLLDYAIGTDLTTQALSERLGGSAAVALFFLLAFAVGHAVVAPDHAEGQIEFLDSLPTSRTVVFAAKLVAATAVVAALLLVDLGLVLGGAAVGLAPPGTTVVPAVLVGWGVQVAVAFGALGLGVLLSWTRQLAWGFLVAMLLFGAVISAIHPPLEAYAVMGGLGDLIYDDGRPSHPLGPLALWVGVGLASSAVSYLLFVVRRAGGSPLQLLASAAVRLSLVGGLFALVLPCGLCGGFTFVLQSGGAVSQGVEVAHTRDFRVLHRGSERAAAMEVAGELDALSERVGALVGHGGPLALDVELLGVPANHAGTFDGGSVRLAPGVARDTLAHELAHAHAFALSGPTAWEHRSSVRFFDEGLAEWVVAALVDAPAVPQLAAAIHRSDPITFDLLVDDERLIAERDLAQAYALGQAFVAALDDAGGAPLRRCLLVELGRVRARHVAGLALWYHLAGRCDLDLPAAVDRMTAALAVAGEALPPPPSVRATLRGDHIVVAVDGEPAGPEVVCRFRGKSDTEVSKYAHVFAVGGRCRVPTGSLTGRQFDYQIGAPYPEEPVFGRWVTDRLR